MTRFGSSPKLRQINLEVDRAYDPVQQFAEMLHTRTREHLDAWLDQVEKSKLPELLSFAAGVKEDQDAVRAGLTWWINNGMVEGHVTKLKLIRKTEIWPGGLSSAPQARPSCTVGRINVLSR